MIGMKYTAYAPEEEGRNPVVAMVGGIGAFHWVFHHKQMRVGYRK
jgi:hypothetical protein